MFFLPESNEKNFKNIVFDFGGVIFELPSEDFIIKMAFSSRNEFEIEKLAKAIFQTDVWMQFDKGLSYSIVKEQLCRQINRELPSIACDDTHINRLIEVIKECMVPREDTLALIRNLKNTGYQIYGLTNMPKEIFEHLISNYNVSSNFLGITSSWETSLAKPDKMIYQRLITDHNLRAEETILLDDRPCNLIEATNLGIKTILFTTAKEAEEQLNAVLGLIRTIPSTQVSYTATLNEITQSR